MTSAAVERIGGDIPGAVDRLLSRVALPDLSQKTVLIKPNMGRLAGGLSGIVANPETILAVCNWFLAKGVGQLQLGDSPITGVKSVDAFERAGLPIDSLPDNIQFIDLDAEPPIDVPVPEGRLISGMRVCAAVQRADFVVSLPVMKTHMHTVVSLGLKNMKGCLYRKEKVKFHQLDGVGDDEKTLDIAIADLATVLLPDLTIVDGSVGMEGFGPSSGETVHPGLLIAGTDCIAVDTVGAALMNIEPTEVPVLRLCAERGIGINDLQQITVDPPEYQDWIHPFRKAPSSIDINYDGIFVNDSGACSACMSTLLLFLERYEDEIKSLFNNEPIHVYIGDKNEVKDRPNTILIGRCTSQDKGQGIFIKGCPPVASYILEQLREKAGKK